MASRDTVATSSASFDIAQNPLEAYMDWVLVLDWVDRAVAAHVFAVAAAGLADAVEEVAGVGRALGSRKAQWWTVDRWPVPPFLFVKRVPMSKR